MTFIGCQEENVSCGVGIHSSIKIFNFHNSTETEAAASLRCPQMLLQASNDPDNTKQGGDVYAVLQSLPIGGACVMREFPQVQHGWVPRGDLSDPVVSQNVRAAMDLSRAFLNEHLRS